MLQGKCSVETELQERIQIWQSVLTWTRTHTVKYDGCRKSDVLKYILDLIFFFYSPLKEQVKKYQNYEFFSISLLSPFLLPFLLSQMWKAETYVKTLKHLQPLQLHAVTLEQVHRTSAVLLQWHRGHIKHAVSTMHGELLYVGFLERAGCLGHGQLFQTSGHPEGGLRYCSDQVTWYPAVLDRCAALLVWVRHFLHNPSLGTRMSAVYRCYSV